MPVKKTVQKPSYNVEGCTIQNIAAPCSAEQTNALNQLAIAAAENAKAIAEIAKSLKGSDAHMEYGMFFGSEK